MYMERIEIYVNDLWRNGIRTVESMELNDWCVVFAVLVVFGVMCMQGASNKTNY
jgi:hypothetical protein